MTNVEFSGRPQNGKKYVELSVTFTNVDVVGIRAHADIIEINGETGKKNGMFDISGPKYLITKKDGKIENEFPNLSLKPIVAIEAGKECWEVDLPDLEYTWSYGDDDVSECSG